MVTKGWNGMWKTLFSHISRCGELERLVGVKCQLYADDLVLWTETPKYHAEAILSIALDILDHWCQDNMSVIT
ncbi:hypothetical protein TNIN_353111 [Trichonephila inaurata madagascariensis]|uniref:Reverse transcriptase domain-containing protein n=1 Tax=Trichonephila inaurata madagascariensis TaxID=2747483 RepID=A0A8X7CHC2_9ARAC|nr:hypothetical protein TNIN_353111 [Trichonephila inaurata madagascariensis]